MKRKTEVGVMLLKEKIVSKPPETGGGLEQIPPC